MNEGGHQHGQHSIDVDEPVFIISVAAQLAGMHPQTLRQYDRIGLVTADRTPGGGRRYSLRQVERLRTVQRLSQEEGINLGGVQRILELTERVSLLETRIAELTARLLAAEEDAEDREAALHALYRAELVPVRRSTTEMTVWRPQRRRARVVRY